MTNRYPLSYVYFYTAVYFVKQMLFAPDLLGPGAGCYLGYVAHLQLLTQFLRAFSTLCPTTLRIMQVFMALFLTSARSKSKKIA